MTRSAVAEWIVFIAFGAFLASCGGNDICLNCTGGPTGTTPQNSVTDEGTILRSFPVVRPELMKLMIVSICIDQPADVSLETCQGTSDHFVAFPDSEGEFTASSLTPGGQQIFFWVDEDEDGRYAPPEPLARMDDPDDQLDDLRAGQLVTMSDIDINFDTATATAAISVSTSTPTPTPSATPTP